jgi:hypothetical protein
VSPAELHARTLRARNVRKVKPATPSATISAEDQATLDTITGKVAK